MAGIGVENDGALWRAFRQIAGLVGDNCNVSADQRRFLLSGMEYALQTARIEGSASLDKTLLSCIDVVRRQKDRLPKPGDLSPAEGFRVGTLI